MDVLGAFDAATHELTTMCNETTINAEAIGELLKKLSARHAGLTMTLVVDNARYQRCVAVMKLPGGCGSSCCFCRRTRPTLL